MKKTLITYFSASGQTKDAANKIALKIPGDIVEILPKDKYTSDDLNWTNKMSRSSREMSDRNSRPEIIKQEIDINNYDTVIIGFPIWWYTAPTIINTFLESYDFSKQEIILFATSGGSSITKSLNDLKQSYPSLQFTDGVLCNSTSDIKKIEKIIKGNDTE